MRGKPMTASYLLVMVVAAVLALQSAARPLRKTREITANVSTVQVQLKLAINALSIATRPSSLQFDSQQRRACELWNEVIAAQNLTVGNSSEQSSTAENIKSITCQTISEETGFSVIQQDGSCSEAVLEYLCSNLAQRESYDLFSQINVDIADYNQWVRETFNDTLGPDRIQELFS